MEGALRDAFSPEFLGRIDQIVPFERLSKSAMEAIAWKYLYRLQERVLSQGTQIQYPEDLAAFLLKKCPPADGARQLRRLVQSEVEGPLASYLLRCSRRPSKLKLHLEGESVSFRP